MRRRYHSYCGCCGQPCHETGDWCDPCAEHVGYSGPPWERTYFAVTGKPCPFEDINGCGLKGDLGYCERPEGHDGPHSTTVWWPAPATDGALAELIDATNARMSDDTNED